MLQSMTGFGRANGNWQNKSMNIEIKSLNSKFTDLRLKLPNNYKDKETELRKIIQDDVVRGKIEFTLEVVSAEDQDALSLNVPLFKKYFTALNQLKLELQLEQVDLMQSILRMPNVISSETSVLDDGEWQFVQNLVRAALKDLRDFRGSEGIALSLDLEQRIQVIQDLLIQIKPYEGSRIEKLREKLLLSAKDFIRKESFDQNRYEQEVMYYLEKIDITEEKVRLNQHCSYFMDTLKGKDTQKGRKLGFISQEIGREINTLGAKANDSNIQKIVVQMKDELEKIKEQIANIV
jgi:uncharacterized protein (TIGR00255 family)